MSRRRFRKSLQLHREVERKNPRDNIIIGVGGIFALALSAKYPSLFYVAGLSAFMLLLNIATKR
jgi:hypothetical protein